MIFRCQGGRCKGQGWSVCENKIGGKRRCGFGRVDSGIVLRELSVAVCRVWDVVEGRTYYVGWVVLLCA